MHNDRKAVCLWLGCEDSNLGMRESESRALPLGDTPSCKEESFNKLALPGQAIIAFAKNRWLRLGA